MFHYTRKWLQRHAQSNMERAPQQLKMARAEAMSGRAERAAQADTVAGGR